MAIPGVSLTETSFQKRFCKTVAGLDGMARSSRPFCRSSACFLFLSIRSSGTTAAGSGGGGGGSAVVGKGIGFAEQKAELCRSAHLERLRCTAVRFSKANSALLNAGANSIKMKMDAQLPSKHRKRKAPRRQRTGRLKSGRRFSTSQMENGCEPSLELVRGVPPDLLRFAATT